MPSAGASCLPVSDHTVIPIETPAATFYVKQGSFTVRAPVSVPVPEKVWRETNAIPGLQPNSEYACGGAADFEQARADF